MTFSASSSKKYPTEFRSASRPGFYVPGQGTFQNKPNTYVNDVGETVIQPGGVLRHTDGSLHQAYAAQPGSYIAELIEKWKRGEPLTADEIEAINEYLATNPTAGLPSVDDLGGNHNGGIFTKSGTKSKNTAGTKIVTKAPSNAAQRRPTKAATFRM